MSEPTVEEMVRALDKIAKHLHLYGCETFPDYRDYLQAIRKHLEKPTVSREQISDIIDREYRDAEYRSDKYPHGPESYDVKAMVAIVIKDIFGIEVSDDKVEEVGDGMSIL